MKKYLVQKTLEAEEMLQYEAEARLGREINNQTKECMGFLTCNIETLEWDWEPETTFRGKPCDTPLENAFLFQDFVSKWQTFFRKYPKIKENISQDERLQVYQINRHLKAINVAIQKILNCSIINNTTEL
jgi:hypothetical protein